MSSQAPTRFAASREATAAREASAKPLLAFFINQYDRAIGFRLQKLAFYAEAVYHQEQGDRLTNVEWRPYMYGMYAEDISNALQDFQDSSEAETTKTLYKGKCTVAHLSPPAEHTIADEHHEFLTGIHEETKSIDTGELMQWTKEHPLYQRTEYAEVVDFDRHSY